MERSLKFKILFECYNIKALKDFILPHELITEETSTLPFKNCILRSALKTESSGLLNSGVGVSVTDVTDIETFNTVKLRLLKQDNLDFIIAQPMIHFDSDEDYHLTIFSTKHFDFIESSGTKITFEFINNYTRSSSKNYMKPLGKFLELFKQSFPGEYILEMGYSKKSLYLFQANTLENKDLEHSFYTNILSKSIQLNNKLKTNSLFNHIRIEFEAYKFREKFKSLCQGQFSLSNCFENWFFIFFYFKLFCIKEKLTFSQNSFEQFLNSSNSKLHLSKMLKKHLEISRYSNRIFEFNTNSLFRGSTEIYIGTGVVEGIIDERVLIAKELDPKELESKQPVIVFSTYNSILGHPALLCAELGIPLMGGLEVETIDKMTAGDKFSVDFNLKQFSIEYRE